jgi:hypothetical protein
MTVEFLTDTTGFNVRSDVFDLQFPSSNVLSVVLSAKINCCDSDFSMELSNADLFVGTSDICGTSTNTCRLYNVLPSFFNQTTIKDGVYNFTLTTTFSDNSIQTEDVCTLVDETLKCSIVDHLAKDTSDVTAAMLHFTLVNSLDCDCLCDKACTIYEALLRELNINSSNSTIQNCDCS